MVKPLGGCSFVVCTHCTRMYAHGMKCPACGNPKHREFRRTTQLERQRWQEKKYFGDPNKELEHV